MLRVKRSDADHLVITGWPVVRVLALSALALLPLAVAGRAWRYGQPSLLVLMGILTAIALIAIWGSARAVTVRLDWPGRKVSYAQRWWWGRREETLELRQVAGITARLLMQLKMRGIFTPELKLSDGRVWPLDDDLVFSKARAEALNEPVKAFVKRPKG